MMMVKSDYVNSSDVDDLDDACPSNVNIGYGVVLCEKCLRLQAGFRKVFGHIDFWPINVCKGLNNVFSQEYRTSRRITV